MRVMHRSRVAWASLTLLSSSLASGQIAPALAPLSDTAVATAVQAGDTTERPPFAAIGPGTPVILVYGPRERIALAAYLARQRGHRFTIDSVDGAMRAAVVEVRIVPRSTLITAMTLVDSASGSVTQVLRPTTVDTLRGDGMIVEARFTPTRVLLHPSLVVKWTTGYVVLPLTHLRLN